MPAVNKSDLLNGLPHVWPHNLMPSIEELVKKANVKIVVLDDDPTGTQTVHNVYVLTEWTIPVLVHALSDPTSVVYVLTNTRSLSLGQAQSINRQIALNLQAAADISGRSFVVISRSDSTLRGHYPGEVDALISGLQTPFDGVLIIPFFEEGGRLTIADIHYVTAGESLIPAGETEYARDPVFSYQNSDLRAWICEKHNGHIDVAHIAHITLNDIRVGGPRTVAEKLTSLKTNRICVVNATTYRDLEVVVKGLLWAESTGKRFLYRTAASFVRVRGGLKPQPILNTSDFPISHGRGLVIAGSYVNKTTEQLSAANELSHIKSITLSTEKVLNDVQAARELERVANLVESTLRTGYDVLLLTSRKYIEPTASMSALYIAKTISTALVSIVKSLKERPAWIIAKGGITASDIATRGLCVRKAYVLGQILPGVPVWRTGRDSRWADITYVVFPGNVGDVNALTDVIHKLRGY